MSIKVYQGAQIGKTNNALIEIDYMISNFPGILINQYSIYEQRYFAIKLLKYRDRVRRRF